VLEDTSRRKFFKRALGMAGATSWTLLERHPVFAGVASPPRRKAVSDQVTLGKTGIRLSRLAMGSGTRGFNKTSVQARLGVQGFADILVHAFDQGVNFFETADQYGTHEHMREGMRRVGLNKVVLLTKTRARTAKEATDDLDRFRRELGRDYIDIVLLHCTTSATWTTDLEGPMEVLSRAKEKGIIRAHGVSCHSLPALKLAALSPWVDVDLARINPAGVHMDANPATVLAVLREMKAAGKGIIGMKIFGQGDLSDQADAAVGHAAKLDLLDAFTIGFSSTAELNEVARKLPVLSAA
jgi:1-deoxyxylulose-5-phosphate synthase